MALNNSTAVPRNAVSSPYTTAQNRNSTYAPTSQATQRNSGYDPYATSSYSGRNPEAAQLSEALRIIMNPTAQEKQRLQEAGVQIPSIGSADLEGILASGAQIPSAGSITYETEKGTTVQLSAAQLRNLQAGKKIEVKDSKGKKFKLELKTKTDKKTGQTTYEFKEEQKKGWFKSLITAPITGIKKAAGFVKDHWKGILMTVGIAALAIGTFGAGAAFAPAMMSIASGVNVTMGAVSVGQGLYNGFTGKGWDWTGMALGAAGAMAGGAGLVAKGSNFAKLAGNINTGTRLSVGTGQAIKNRSILNAVGLAANGLGWYASSFNTPLSGSVDTLNQISRGASVAMTANQARRGNLGAMFDLGQSIQQNGLRGTFDPRAQPQTQNNNNTRNNKPAQTQAPSAPTLRPAIYVQPAGVESLSQRTIKA